MRQFFAVRTDLDFEVAAQHAVENKLISADEATTEKMILLHFVPILSGLLDRSTSQVTAFRMRLQAEGRKIAPIVKQLVRFSETKGIARVPLFLVPNPEEGSGGGGYNGEKLVVEIQADPDPLPILFHETLHALLRQHKEAIQVAADSVRLSWVELNEGLAYAFSPGLIDPQGPNSLPERLIKKFSKRRTGIGELRAVEEIFCCPAHRPSFADSAQTG